MSADAVEQTRPERKVAQRRRSPGRCDYCGSPLQADFYFCLGCGTPYASHQAVITPAQPRKLTDEERVRQRVPGVFPLFWTYVGVVLLTAIVSSALFYGQRPDLAMLFANAAIFITTCVFAAMHWRTLAVQFRRLGLRIETLVGLAVLIPLLLTNYLYHVALLEWLGFEQSGFEGLLSEAGFSHAALILSVCLLPAVTEEIAFRGLVQHWLQVALRPWKAMVLASALFAALHFSFFSLPYLFAVGMLLGWLKFRTGSLYPPMLVHFLHNLLVIELLAAGG